MPVTPSSGRIPIAKSRPVRFFRSRVTRRSAPDHRGGAGSSAFGLHRDVAGTCMEPRLLGDWLSALPITSHIVPRAVWKIGIHCWSLFPTIQGFDVRGGWGRPGVKDSWTDRKNSPRSWVCRFPGWADEDVDRNHGKEGTRLKSVIANHGTSIVFYTVQNVLARFVFVPVY